MQKWLDNNDMLMYSIHKSVVAGKFKRTLKSKIHKKCQLMIASLILIV